MITKLHIENFKCLRDVTVELQPLTVLIGKNDTGKTSFLEALGMLGALTSGEMTPIWQENDFDTALWRGAKERRITWEATIAPSPLVPLPGLATYKLAIGAAGGRALPRSFAWKSRRTAFTRASWSASPTT